MMARGIKVRLAAFLVLSAVGIVYVASSYLGFVDALLGRGYTLKADLPESGGLYVGGEVTYRGVNIGEISRMRVTPDGVRLDLAIKEGTKIPEDVEMYVHNESAVGEQYLDLEPSTTGGPYLTAGEVLDSGESTMPVTEQDLLVDLDAFVGSVDRRNLRTVVGELGTMFRDTGRPLQRLLDGGDAFISEAKASEEQTTRLFDSSVTVLRTQNRQGGNIRSFADDLAGVTDTLRRSDQDLREVIDGGGGAAREVDSLLRSVEPTLPVMLGNLVTVNQVVTTRLPAVEQLLVTYPRLISSGFTGTSKDGYGHVNLQFADSPPACREGYLDPDEWRPGSDLSDAPIYLDAHCASGPPFNMRGSKYAPEFGSGPSGSSFRAAPYDPRTGATTGSRMMVGSQGGQQALFGEDSWKWLLIGPMERR